jgi:hypothetical protein
MTTLMRRSLKSPGRIASTLILPAGKVEIPDTVSDVLRGCTSHRALM